MGKIKPRSIRSAARKLEVAGVKFEPDFEKNKKIIGDFISSKKLRNQLAGLTAKKEKRKADNSKL